jgi:high affinity Mn2+ porin
VRDAVTLPWAGALCRLLWAVALVACAARGVAAEQPADQAQQPQELPPLRPAQPLKPQPIANPGGSRAASNEKGAAAEKTGEEAGPPVSEPKEGEAAEKPKREPWYSVHGQGTIVSQKHDIFPSPYIGPLSLLPSEPFATTETATLFLDVRLWHGADLVFNPEISGGRGFSGTSGVAGFPNGEATRVGQPEPTPYIARLLVRQTWGLDGEREKVEDGPNQIAGIRDVNRFTIMVGKMSATDIADNNAYSHDPRTQMLDWALMYNGAWDYPANVRGYTYGVAIDFNTVFWALHYGIFAEPAEANGAPLDPHIADANGQILELQENYRVCDLPGKLREWFYLNHAHMGKYSEALDEMPVNPDVTLTRAYRFKYGFGLNWEQELTRDLGLWARAGWSDGRTESWAFTAIDSSASGGVFLKGRVWHRPNDTVGVAGVISGLSRVHRDYLSAGGLDFIIGDGKLNYAPEEILEMYYDIQLHQGIFVTFDFEGVNDPAFNADRGPVAIGTIRVHFEY